MVVAHTQLAKCCLQNTPRTKYRKHLRYRSFLDRILCFVTVAKFEIHKVRDAHRLVGRSVWASWTSASTEMSSLWRECVVFGYAPISFSHIHYSVHALLSTDQPTTSRPRIQPTPTVRSTLHFLSHQRWPCWAHSLPKETSKVRKPTWTTTPRRHFNMASIRSMHHRHRPHDRARAAMRSPCASSRRWAACFSATTRA